MKETKRRLERLSFYDHTGIAAHMEKMAASSAQLQVFYNERENPIPIETDPVTEVDTLHRAARRSFLPTYFLLLAVALLTGWMFIGQILNDPIALLASPLSLFYSFSWMPLLLLCTVELISYYRWRAKAKKAEETSPSFWPGMTSISTSIGDRSKHPAASQPWTTLSRRSSCLSSTVCAGKLSTAAK